MRDELQGCREASGGGVVEKKGERRGREMIGGTGEG